jgi:ribosomal protein S18 acetylase RimI-like enzyme
MLATIHRQCFLDNWNENSFQNMLINKDFFGFVIELENSECCGFILCRKIIDEIEIITFCVMPQHRKRGYGRFLLLELINFARNLCMADKRPLHNDVFSARARMNVDTCVVAQDRSVLDVHENPSSVSDEVNCEKDALCSGLDNHCANGIKVFIEVAKDNLEAINLYKSIKFEKISERSKYYKTPSGLVDAIVLMRVISKPHYTK